MKRWALGALALLLLLIGGAWWFLHSAWLQKLVRGRLLAVVESATGSPASIRESNFDWRSWTLVARGVSSGPVKIAALRVTLRPRSLWSRSIDVASIQADRPEIDLPEMSGRAQGLPDLFAIHVGRYEIRHGMLHLRAQTRAFDLRGEDLRADLTRERNVYSFDAASQQVSLQTECCGPLRADFSAKGTIGPEQITLAQWQAHVYPQSASYSGAALTLDGAGRYSDANGFTAQGNARGSFRGIDVTTTFHSGPNDVLLGDLTARLLGGAFHGIGTIRTDRSWGFSGRLDGIDLRDAAEQKGLKLPLDARASGPVSGTSADGVTGELHLAGGINGEVRARATTAGVVTFEESHLIMARSQIDFSGSKRSGFEIRMNTSDLAGVERLLASANLAHIPANTLVLLPGGNARFAGTLRFNGGQPVFAGDLTIQQFRASERDWQKLDWTGEATRSGIHADHLELTAADVQLTGSGTVALSNWQFLETSALHAKGTFSLTDFAFAPRAKGNLSGSGEIKGSLAHPAGTASVNLRDGEVYGENIRHLVADVAFDRSNVEVSQGRLRDEAGDHLAFSGSYRGEGGDKHLDLQLATRSFLLSHVSGLSGVDGKVAADVKIAADISAEGVRPVAINGAVSLTNAAYSGTKLGDVSARIETVNQHVDMRLSGAVHGNPFAGDASVALQTGNPLRGSLQFTNATCDECFPSNLPLKISGTGLLTVSGPLLDWRNWSIHAHASQLEFAAKSFPFALRSVSPAEFTVAGQSLTIHQLQLVGPDTSLAVRGTASPKQLNLNADGAFSLKLLRLLNSSIDSADGRAVLKASVAGSLQQPQLAGNMQISDGAVRILNLTDGLTNLNGSVVFDQNRATIQKLSGEAGGGKLTFVGFVAFGGSAPLAYHLESHAEDMRLRYANGVSLTANATLRLTGTSTNSVLSGVAQVSRVVLTPTADVGNLLSNLAAGAVTPANQKAFGSGLQFDVAIESAPNLQINTSLSRDVEAAIDLRLRGTPVRPILLGTISANQGDIRVFGGRYTINRGEVTFQNASAIDPVLDLDLETQARGIDVDITISGTFSRLNISYRSDPPLQPRDIIALLTVGRTPQEAANVQTSQITPDSNALTSNPSSVLGQAITQPSGRLSKLFGVTNIKLDPLVQGLTNTPQSRLTIEQQISRSITVTYVTNLEQTSEQIFRFEWAINRQYSIVAIRDDNGEFGIDLQYKKRFK